MEQKLLAEVSGNLVDLFELFCNAAIDTCFDG